MRKINIPIFVSHLGCPNNCIFCDQKKITGMSGGYDFDGAYEKIKTSLETAPPECEAEIAFFGGSFTGIEKSAMERYLKIANEFFSDGRVKGIRLSTRPDYISEEIVKILKNYGVTTVELGVQSMDDKILDMNKRNLKAEDTVRAAGIIKESGITLGLQMMTGMYGSTHDMDIYTAERIIDLKPSVVRIYPTVVIEGTELYDLYLKGEYAPYNLEETVNLCARLFDMFEERNIRVIRAGLMSSGEINEKKVIGPYHSAFGELVASRRYYTKISEILKRNAICGKNLVVYVPKTEISKATGNKKSNLSKLKEEFSLMSVLVKEGESFKVVWED